MLFREKQGEERVKLLKESLSAFALVKDAEDKGKISGEIAGQFRHYLTQNIEMILDTGATTSSAGSVLQVNPRVLMAPSQKLLAAPEKKSAAKKRSRKLNLDDDDE